MIAFYEMKEGRSILFKKKNIYDSKRILDANFRLTFTSGESRATAEEGAHG